MATQKTQRLGGKYSVFMIYDDVTMEVTSVQIQNRSEKGCECVLFGDDEKQVVNVVSGGDFTFTMSGKGLRMKEASADVFDEEGTKTGTIEGVVPSAHYTIRPTK